jgi:D-alanine-D-alanine ligase
MNPSVRIVVMMGGFSSEREISMKSGQGVLSALREKGYDVESYIVEEGTLAGFESEDFDVAFIALHGEFGEDGGIQDCLEQRGLSYTGSDPEASRLAMDKIAAKARFAEAGLRVAPHVHLKSFAELRERELEIARLGFPLIVKPVREGSSIGLNLVRHHGELLDAIEDAAQYQAGIMVEEFIPGRELTVGILGDRPLPVIEIRPPELLFDFSAKYSGQSKYLVPAPLEAPIAARAREVALAAHLALGCRDVSRVDLRMEETETEPVVLEVNTIPGMTATSLLPKAAKLVGLSYSEVCEKLVERALARQRQPAELAALAR